MKKIFTFTVITALLIVASIRGFANPYTVTVDSPGQVKSKVNAAVGGAQNYNLITSLTVIGPMNKSDVTFLQELGEGPDYGGMGILQHLDITETSLPGNLLHDWAFARVAIKEMLMPNSVVTYDFKCFANTKIEYVKIGTSTSVLFQNPYHEYDYYDYSAFSNTPQMMTIEVAADNLYFTSVDGVLFSKDMKALVAYPTNRTGSSYTIPEGVEIIQYDAFGNTKNLRTVIFPNSLHTLSDYAFSGSQNLNTIVWGTGLETIGYSAFMWTTGMGEVSLPEGLKVVGYSAFFNAQMTKMTGPSTLLSIEQESFRGDGMSGNSLVTLDFSRCTKLTKISSTSFYDNFILSTVLLPEGLKVIGDAAFQNCYSIVNLVIPNSVETIQGNAFLMLSEMVPHQMKTVVLGKGIKNINGDAFGNCDKIREIWSLNPVPGTLANSGFEVALNHLATLYVPTGTKQAYQNANRWRDFSNIVEDDFTDVAPITANSAKVYTAVDYIVIENAAPLMDVSVFSMNGALMTKTQSQGSTLRIPANKGAYVVRVGTSSTKVVL